MSVLPYGEFPSQQSFDKIHPSQGASQFKTPMKFQSGKQPAQGQHAFTQGSAFSRGVSQFKVPLSPQTGTLRAQNQPYSPSGAPHFNNASLYHVTNPSQPLVQQPERWGEQSGYYPPSGMHLSNAAVQHLGPTMSLPRVQALSPVAARATYSAGGPITYKSSVLPAYSNNISTDPYIDISARLSTLEAQRQGRSTQFLRKSDRSWQPVRPRTEPLVRSEAPRKTKTHVTMKVILMGGTVLLMGGIASFLLLRFPTFLVVTWAILIIVLSNLVSREIRSYYQLTPTTLHMEAEQPSTISTTSDDVDMGRHPVLKDISDTTGYLKALCLVVKPDQPAQIFPSEKGY